MTRESSKRSQSDVSDGHILGLFGPEAVNEPNRMIPGPNNATTCRRWRENMADTNLLLWNGG